MAEIGKLSVAVTIQGQQFTAELNKKTQELKKFGDQANKHGKAAENSFGKLFGAAVRVGSVTASGGPMAGLTSALGMIPGPAGAAASAIVGIGSSLQSTTLATATAVQRQTQLADSLNTTRNAINSLSNASGLSGVSESAVNSAAQSVRQLIDDASTGAGFATQRLNELGLELSNLQSLSLDQQLNQIGQALQGISDPTARATAGFRLFGNQYSSLQRLFQSGALSQSGTGTLSERQQRNLELLNRRSAELSQAWQGLITTLSAELAPELTRFVNQLTEAVRQLNSLADLVPQSGQGVGTPAATSLGFGLTNAMISAANYLFDANITPINNNGVFGNATPSNGPGGAGGGPNNGLARNLAELNTLAENMAINANFTAMASEEERRLAEYRRRFGQEAVSLAENQVRAAIRMEQAAQIINQTRTPLERFANDIRRIRNAMQFAGDRAGVLAQAQAFEQLAATAPNVNSLALPVALAEGSQAAGSAITQAIRAAAAGNEDPQERVRRVLEVTQEIERRQLDYARRLAEALERQNVAQAGQV